MLYGVISACIGVVIWESALTESQRSHLREGTRCLMQECLRRLPQQQ